MKTRDMLDWYSQRILGADEAVMFTGGFGVSEFLAPAFAKDRDFLRFILLEKPPTKKSKALLGDDRDLVIVYGNVLGDAYFANKKASSPAARKFRASSSRNGSWMRSISGNSETSSSSIQKS